MFRLKPLALLIGLLGTTHSYAASNTADLTQSGAQNTAALTQTGQGNHSVQVQLGTDTRQTVLQTGELNAASIYQGERTRGTIDIDQSGESHLVEIYQDTRGWSTVAVTQRGSVNEVRIDQGSNNAGRVTSYQEGTHNLHDFRLENMSGTPSLSARTLGNGNTMRVVQGEDAQYFMDADLVQNGDNNLIDLQQQWRRQEAEVNQQGNGNIVQVQQSGLGPIEGELSGSLTQASQNGNDNVMNVRQGSDGNTLISSQNGDRNTLDVQQWGWSGYLTTKMTNRLEATVNGNDNRMTVVQTGGAGAHEITAEQTGNNNEMNLSQRNTTDSSLDMAQRGDGLAMTVTQMNTQNDHFALVQEGTNHTLSLERSGIGNEAIVSQLGTANMASMIQQ